MEHKTLRIRKRMYVPADVCSHARSGTGRGGKGREGRKEREQEGGVPKIYQQQEGHTTTISAIWVRSVCPQSTLCHMFLFVGMATQHGGLLHWRLFFFLIPGSYRPHDKLPVVLWDWTVCLRHFLMFVKRRGTKFSQRVYSEKTHSWSTFLLLQEADRVTPFAAPELPSDMPLSLVCFSALDCFNA